MTTPEKQPAGPSTMHTSPVTPVGDDIVHLKFLYYEALALFLYLLSVFNIKDNPFKKHFEDFKLKILIPLYNYFKNVPYYVIKFIDDKVVIVVNFLKKVWLWLNRVLMYPVTLQFAILAAAFHLARLYNSAVYHIRINYPNLGKHIPYIPIRRIRDILEEILRKIVDILKDPLKEIDKKFVEYTIQDGEFQNQIRMPE